MTTEIDDALDTLRTTGFDVGNIEPLLRGEHASELVRLHAENERLTRWIDELDRALPMLYREDREEQWYLDYVEIRRRQRAHLAMHGT